MSGKDNPQKFEPIESRRVWAAGLVLPAIGYIVSCVYLSIVDEQGLQVVCCLSALLCTFFVFCVLYFWRDWQISHRECLDHCLTLKEKEKLNQSCVQQAIDKFGKPCIQTNCNEEYNTKESDCGQGDLQNKKKCDEAKENFEKCMDEKCQNFYTELGKCYGACRHECSAKLKPWIRKHWLSAFLLFFLAFTVPCALLVYRVANQDV